LENKVHKSFLMKFIAAILLVFLLSANAFSQDRCSSVKYMMQILGEDHDLLKSHEKSIKDWKERSSNTVRSIVEVTIPVHIIIQHDPSNAIGTGDNLSLERIQSQIDVMNEDFSGTNAEFSTVPSEFAKGQSEISFCLASVDPQGNPTDGITRFGSTLSWENNKFTIMSQTIWDRDQYLNIYVTPSIVGLGISPIPSTSYTIPEDWDAPAVLTSSFGGPGFATATNYDLGRTAVHEIGHWLGLSHVWGPNAGGCGEDDGMDDTPLQEEPNYECPEYPHADACSSSLMFMNFMDYVDDNKMHTFSEDQVDYMHFIIEEVRPGLLASAITNCSGVSSSPLSATITETIQNNCWNEDNGFISISAAGGQAPYNFSIDGVNLQSTGDFSNLENGAYTFTIADSNNESVSVSANISSGPEILAEVVAVTEPCSGLSNGSFGIVSTGGTGGLSVLVDNNSSAANDFFDNLSSGAHQIVVTDELGCQVTLEYELIDLVDPITVSTIDIISPDCMTGPDGGQVSFNVTSTNPVANYNLGGQINTSPDFSGLIAGGYDYIITDTQGCFTEGSLDIDPATEFQVNTLTTDVTCFGAADGSIEFTVDGIQGGFTSFFNNEVITDNLITDLNSDNYTLTIEDEEGCVVELIIPVGSPQEIISFIELTPPTCDEPTATIELSGEGGTGMLSFEVDGFSNNSGTFPNLEGGTYEILTTDEVGCQASMNYVVPDFQLFEIDVVASAPVGCAGDATGVIEISITGGTAPFEYYLDEEFSDEPIFENLEAGDYTIEVIDAEGCINEITATIMQPSTFSIDIETTTGGCDAGIGNSLTITPEGGEAPYTLIVNGEEQTSFNLTDLPSGDYTVEVLDDEGCSSGIENVSLQGASPIEIVIDSHSNVSCFGRDDGFIDYSFDTEVGITGITFIPDGTNFNSLTAGSYTIQVINADGCAAEVSIEITEPEELAIEDEVLIAAGNLAGSATFTMAGGTAPFNFEVNGVENQDGIFSLLQGDYTLRVTDANGCMLVHDFMIDLESSLFETDAISLKVHPNPVTDYIYLECKECTHEAAYRILGIDGKILRPWQNVETQISLENIPSGVILFEVKEGLNTASKRLIKN